MKVFENKQQAVRERKRKKTHIDEYFILSMSEVATILTLKKCALPSGVQNVSSKCNCMQIVASIDGKYFARVHIIHIHNKHTSYLLVGCIIIIRKLYVVVVVVVSSSFTTFCATV